MHLTPGFNLRPFGTRSCRVPPCGHHQTSSAQTCLVRATSTQTRLIRVTSTHTRLVRTSLTRRCLVRTSLARYLSAAHLVCGQPALLAPLARTCHVGDAAPQKPERAATSPIPLVLCSNMPPCRQGRSSRARMCFILYHLSITILSLACMPAACGRESD